ncbi:C-terminal processing protease CtpA/Prc, contains a PDZ domain [Flavobacterium fluvii]|uniref:C-terminal processing protease CtpA/Prc, contains a PDZ domain n=1 Tax=Flavobacterium fluvii TaxID=468056 RepID=A0A1M5E866_9FLAO|nr:S41 family peptidase [Flavobacterium fluvii]SHF75251.1 C-terminal processing protease CtpA/Prc, contains a PDZ domain [Flavobacterium fluvii]
MKKIFFCLFLLSSSHLFSNTKISEIQKYKQIGLVWGLLKYHHPEISKGKYDWDSEFVKLVDKAEGVENQEAMNDLLLDFISRFGTDKLKAKKINSEKIFLKNLDYAWIDSSVFGDKLTKTLVEIKENGNINDYYASVNKLAKNISFENEKGFKDFDYSIKSHRMLLLYSFWNATQYWNVNKYLMDTKWSDNLDSMTKEFLDCKTDLEFEIIKSNLITKLNDSHSYYGSRTIFSTLYKYKPAFSIKAVNDSLLIDAVYNKTLAKKDDIELGDIIVKINNKSISSCLHDKVAPMISVSNSTFLRRWSPWLFYNDKDSINVDIIKKNGTQLNKYIHLYNTYKKEEPVYLVTPKKNKWSYIQPDVAYVNLDQITKKELDSVFKQISKTKGLILDLRNYPKNISINDLPGFLYPERKEFIKILAPLPNIPSYGEYAAESPLKLIMDPFKAGQNNPDYYKGKVILLVNRTTQSNAEFIGMAIQQSPNCITIGEQTAGSVLNIVEYIMPDKTKADFTGRGAFYPNGEGVQRNGLHIDHYVKESAKNYDPELYVKEAIRLIEKSSI